MGIKKSFKNALGGLQNFISAPTAPFGVGATYGVTQDGTILKTVIPRFLYRPPWGYPRFDDVPEMRRLSKVPYVEMAIMTLINEIAAVPWEIVAKDKDKVNEKNIENVTKFFENPNINEESFNFMLRMILRDILTIDSGIFVKVFDQVGYLKELYVRDSATFTKNPDVFGTFSGKAELMLTPHITIFRDKDTNKQTLQNIAREAAYFQYGWTIGSRPIPFGTREIVYIMQNPQPDSIYGQAAMEILLKTVQTQVYGMEYWLEFFTNNNMSKGVWKLPGANKEEIKSFADQFKENLQVKDEAGNWRKRFHKIPVVNTKELEWLATQMTSIELELVAQQKWFQQLVLSTFGVTPSEVGMTENTNRANELSQSKVFRRKAIRPLLDLLQVFINSQIVSEFKEGVKLQDGTIVKGVEDVEFRFLMVDITEEIEKAELAEKHIKNKIKTPNEIRDELGLDPVEGGDEMVGAMPQNAFNFPGASFGGDKMKEKEKEEAGMEPKPRPDSDANKDGKKQKKASEAFTSASPLILRSNEVPVDAGALEKAIKRYMDKKEKEILSMLTQAGKQKDVLKDVKATPQIADRVEATLDASTLQRIVQDIIGNAFIKSLNDAELKLDMNFIPSRNSLKFLQDTAFKNVQGMVEETGRKLGQTMRIGIREGWSISRMKSEVKDVFDVSDNRAEMIARTEVNAAENKAVIDVVEQSGLEGEFEWIAAIDDRTSPICRSLNGDKIKKGEKFKTSAGAGFEGIQPPAHVNCRSVLAFHPNE